MFILSYARILILMAVLPGLFLLYQVYKLDRIEKEPVQLLVKLFFFGALTIPVAIILEMIGGEIAEALFDYGTMAYDVFEYFIVVACVEEFGKYFVLNKVTWNHPEFNYRYDAIVYAVCIGMGFAVFENIEYAFIYGFTNTLVRAVTAIPAHCIFAIFMGHYYGQAKYCEYIGSNGESFYRMMSFLVPVLLHGLYDFIASSEDLMTAGIFWIFVIVLDIIAYRRIKEYAGQDEPISDGTYDQTQDWQDYHDGM